MSHSDSIEFDSDLQDAYSLEVGNIAVTNDLKGLAALRTSWCDMQWHPNADIDFYTDVVRVWAERCRPHVLTISRNGSPEALLVGREEIVSIDCRLGYKTLFRVKARQLTFIYGGMLGEFSSENCTLFIKAIRESLKQREADLAEFHFIRTDSCLYRTLSAAKQTRDSSSLVQIHRSTSAGCSADDTYRKMSAKRRKNLRGKKLLQEFEGRVNIRCFYEPDSLAEMFVDVESIACKTYHRKLGVGFDGSKELYQRMLAESKRGRFRAYVLYLANKPAAFWIATAYMGVLYSDFLGYDPINARYSPGMYLITKTLEGLCDSEIDSTIKKVDWGLGDAQYKQVLGDSSWTEANVRIFGTSLKGVAIKAMIVPIATVDIWLKRALANSGLLQKIKTRWRHHLVEKQTPTST
ncbi:MULTISPECIES: GNAT family N-acetyltransferase [Acidobacteriaceae]|uniref:GNAT family N-acetyltransferase n=1 Tax=Acidobacteriaceae TaxID=204434 RepID=UPI00131AB4F1|nr:MULTISPECIES: GNAT family N-acetyltransferase [Acidobacteriaceae]MDW5265951.1 GNAT family N-acetyltransferase [Edaphobacter sp.]